MRPCLALVALLLGGCGAIWTPTYSIGRHAETEDALFERTEDALEELGWTIARSDPDTRRMLVRAVHARARIAVEIHPRGWITVAPASRDARPTHDGWAVSPGLAGDQRDLAIGLRARLEDVEVELDTPSSVELVLGAPAGEHAPTDAANPRWAEDRDPLVLATGGVGLALTWALGIAWSASILSDGSIAPSECRDRYAGWGSAPLIGALAASISGAVCPFEAGSVPRVAVDIPRSAGELTFLALTIFGLVIPRRSVALDGPRAPRLAIAPLRLEGGAGIAIGGVF